MAKQIINVGNTPNDRQGDSLRTAFQKVNANFTELYNEIGSIQIGEINWELIANKPAFSTVATSGSYTDLLNTPTIPTDISQLTDTQGLLVDSYDGGGADSDFSDEETIDGGGA
jgi:hypothetical protein